MVSVCDDDGCDTHRTGCNGRPVTPFPNGKLSDSRERRGRRGVRPSTFVFFFFVGVWAFSGSDRKRETGGRGTQRRRGRGESGDGGGRAVVDGRTAGEGRFPFFASSLCYGSLSATMFHAVSFHILRDTPGASILVLFLPPSTPDNTGREREKLPYDALAAAEKGNAVSKEGPRFLSTTRSRPSFAPIPFERIPPFLLVQ